MEASRNYILNLRHKKAAKYCETHKRFTKSTDLIFRPFRKIFISWHYPSRAWGTRYPLRTPFPFQVHCLGLLLISQLFISCASRSSLDITAKVEFLGKKCVREELYMLMSLQRTLLVWWRPWDPLSSSSRSSQSWRTWPLPRHSVSLQLINAAFTIFYHPKIVFDWIYCRS